MPKRNETDQRILSVLDGRDRIKLLLRERGMGIRDFARKINVWAEEVSMCLAGSRAYPEIRDAIAAELELPRETIDAFIDAQREAA